MNYDIHIIDTDTGANILANEGIGFNRLIINEEVNTFPTGKLILTTKSLDEVIIHKNFNISIQFLDKKYSIEFYFTYTTVKSDVNTVTLTGYLTIRNNIYEKISRYLGSNTESAIENLHLVTHKYICNTLSLSSDFYSFNESRIDSLLRILRSTSGGEYDILIDRNSINLVNYDNLPESSIEVPNFEFLKVTDVYKNYKFGIYHHPGTTYIPKYKYDLKSWYKYSTNLYEKSVRRDNEVKLDNYYRSKDKFHTSYNYDKLYQSFKDFEFNKRLLKSNKLNNITFVGKKVCNYYLNLRLGDRINTKLVKGNEQITLDRLYVIKLNINVSPIDVGMEILVGTDAELYEERF